MGWFVCVLSLFPGVVCACAKLYIIAIVGVSLGLAHINGFPVLIVKGVVMTTST